MAHVAPVNNEQLIRLAKYFGGTIVSDRVLKDKKPGFLREARLLEGRGRTLPLRTNFENPLGAKFAGRPFYKVG